MKENEVWVKFGESGFARHAANMYWVVRKLKRGGYSVRFVERGFNGYTVSTKTQRFEKLEDLFSEVPPGDLYRALMNHPHKEVWKEEIEFLRGLLEKKEKKRELKPLRQATLVEVIS